VIAEGEAAPDFTLPDQDRTEAYGAWVAPPKR